MVPPPPFSFFFSAPPAFPPPPTYPYPPPVPVSPPPSFFWSPAPYQSTTSSAQLWAASTPSPALDSRAQEHVDLLVTGGPVTSAVDSIASMVEDLSFSLPDHMLLLELHDSATPSSEYAFYSPASRNQPDRLPAALPDHASSLLLQYSEVDAFQRHNTSLYLDRLPSSSNTNKKDATVLSHSRLDSVPEVFGEMPTPRSGSLTARILDAIPTSTTHADLSYSKADEGRTFLAYDGSDTHPVLPAYICQGRELTQGNDISSSEDEQIVHKHTGPEIISMDNTAASSPATATRTAPSALIFPTCSNTETNRVHQAAKETMVSQASAALPAEEAVRDLLAREILHIQNRLQQQEYSVQFIQGEVAELSHRVAQIGISLGMQHIQDGTILSQASCFAIQQDVQFSEMPIGDVNDAETDGYLFKNEIPSQPSPVSATATDQTQFQTTEKMPVYDVYEEDTNASPHGVVELSETVGQHRQYDSKKLGATKLSSWESANEVLAVCFDNASDNAFSEEATGFSFPHGPVTHTDRSIKLTNEKTTQAASLPCVQEDNMHCHDPRSGINSKKQDALINKHSIIYPSDLNTDKEVPFPLQYQLPLSSAPCIWDPGINLFSYRKLHIFPWIPSSAIIIL